MIMEEIEPEYFNELKYEVLPKSEGTHVLPDLRLKKIYGHLVCQMELWFQQNTDEEIVKKNFRRDLVDLTRMIEYQDINELLILREFIMVIVVKGKNF